MGTEFLNILCIIVGQLGWVSNLRFVLLFIEFLFCFLKFGFFKKREMGKGQRKKERENLKGPDAGLDLTDGEIMT